MAEKAIDPGILASRRYWAEREEENRRATIRDEKEYAKGIREVLEKAAANIRKEIDAFYGRYAAREGITISDAKMRVSTLDIKEYSRKAKQYVADKDFSKQANEEMRIYNLTMKINRLEMLKSNIGLELCASYSELENYFEDSLTKTARKEFRRQAGILGGTVANIEKHAGEIVNGSFRGAKFSERLWANQAYLKMQLDNLLRTGLIQGRNPRELAKSLRKEIETSVYVSERLMRTEMCRVQIGAQLASYKASGYDRLIIVPEHDERSCDYCESQDGMIVEVAKAEPGVNVPPFHPNCRCSTSAWAGEMTESNGNQLKGDDSDNYINAKQERSSRRKVDITKEWIGTKKEGTVNVASKVVEKGVSYVVDGHNVVSEPTAKEKWVAECLSKKYGFNIVLLPKVNFPKDIQMADYLIDGEKYDLKSPTGKGKTTLYDLLTKKKRQASNYIFNLTDCPLNEEAVEKQMDLIYRSDHTERVKIIVLFKDGAVVKVYKREGT